MKTLSIVLLLLVPGCAPFMNAQSALLAQARHGLEIAQTNRAGASTVYDQLTALKRNRLDDAFDADVREREGDLTVGWVIDARIAYAAALDACARENQSLRESDEIARRNLAAVDAALQRLQFLESIQNRWLKLPEESK